MGPTELFALVVLVVIVAIWVSRRLGTNDAEVKQWADVRVVDLTPDTALVVERYLLWSKRGRRLGALVGFVSPWIYSGISGQAFDEGSWALALMLLGYLFGALAAEVVVDRARTTGTTALMQPRRIVDYLPASLLTVQRVLGVLGLVMIVPYAFFQPDATIDLPGVGTIASYAVGGALIAVIVEMIERRIVARRQSLADISDVEVDDALRSTSIHMVAGAGLALLIQFAGPLVAITLCAAIPGDAGGIVAAVMLVAVLLLSLACWMNIAHPTRYRVQRGLRSAA